MLKIAKLNQFHEHANVSPNAWVARSSEHHVKLLVHHMKKTYLKHILSLLGSSCALIDHHSAFADATWADTTTTTGQTWSTAANWSPAAAPASTVLVVMPGTATLGKNISLAGSGRPETGIL